MGYCYEIRGGSRLLCCDVCGTAGGVRKIRCPYGYCPATALCARCRKNETVKAQMKLHCETNCKAAAEAYDAREKATAILLAAGEMVFCTATGKPGNEVAMGFRGETGEVAYLTVDRSIYEAARAKGGPVTLAEIAKEAS
jgi:hypothetical protein